MIILSMIRLSYLTVEMATCIIKPFQRPGSHIIKAFVPITVTKFRCVNVRPLNDSSLHIWREKYSYDYTISNSNSASINDLQLVLFAHLQLNSRID